MNSDRQDKFWIDSQYFNDLNKKIIILIFHDRCT